MKMETRSREMIEEAKSIFIIAIIKGGLMIQERVSLIEGAMALSNLDEVGFINIDDGSSL